MVFAHDTRVSLETAAALVNTALVNTAFVDTALADTPLDGTVVVDTAAGTTTVGNSAESAGRRDGLADLADLDAFVGRWEFTGCRTRDAAELREVQELRPRLRRLWSAGEDDAVDVVNALLREGRALPQLVRHDSWDYHLHATTPEQGLAVRMAVEFAMAMVDVVRAGELDRLRVCAGEHCDGVLVDLSRNRSRRFCSTRCGNLAHVHAYRARR